MRVRIVVALDVDPSKRSPRELREHVVDAWRAAVMRAHAAGRIDTAVAEEMFRAVAPDEARQ